MAGLKRPKDVSELIKEHETLKNALVRGENAALKYKDDIRNYSEAIVRDEVMNILKNVSVDELNRRKGGFRIKLLKDNGYNTIADITLCSSGDLSSIHGISEDAANAILSEVSDIIRETRGTVRIRISSDKKTHELTCLVNAVAAYAESIGCSQRCTEILKEYVPSADAAVNELRPAAGAFRWLFASKSNKEKAVAASETLYEMLNGEYGEKAGRVTEDLEFISRYESHEYGWDYFNSNSVKFFNIIERINPEFLSGNETVYGLPDELAARIRAQPLSLKGLKCELRQYQEMGVKYIISQKRVLLGDEMGLGKTVQAIAAMVSMRNAGAERFLVVCPAGVLTNWCREIEKMSDLKVIRIHGNDRTESLNKWIENGGVGVTTFETTAFIELYEEFMFDMLVVDEAHYIKNPKAHRTENTLRISMHSGSILLMTGTALENNVDEMISLIDMLRPEVAENIKSVAYLSAAPEFREKIISVYYRRKRLDVLRELPELIEKQEWCTMTSTEAEAYEAAVLSRNFSEVRRLSWNVDDLIYSSKAQRLLEIVSDAELDGRKVIVFTFFLDTVQKAVSLIGEKCLEPVTGSVSPQRRQEIIDEFEKSPSGSVLVLQIQSGGTGLNIQSASVVVFCEPQFKPSIENQAVSRAYRMGQTRNVTVHRLLCENTVDERIMEILEGKQKIFDAFADPSAVNEEIEELNSSSFAKIVEDEAKKIEQNRMQ